MRLKTIAAAGVIGAGMTFFTASNAADVSDVLFTGFQQLSDNSAEYLINCDPLEAGCDSTIGDRTVDVGDRLRGIFTIETVENLTTGVERFLGGASGNQELSGIFDIEVVNKVNLGAGGFFYDFDASGALASLAGVSSDAMVAFYVDDLVEYSRLNDTIVNLETNVTNGDLYWTFGEDGIDDFWQATAISDDIDVIGNAPPPGNGGTFNLGLSFIVDNSGLTFNAVSCGIGSTVDACGSGSLLATGGVNTPYDSFDNVDFVLDVVRVPAPAPLALMSLALMALGFVNRRRNA